MLLLQILSIHVVTGQLWQYSMWEEISISQSFENNSRETEALQGLLKSWRVSLDTALEAIRQLDQS